MSPWDKLLERPHSREHFVQLYQADEASLTRNVGLYIWAGLRRGDGVLLVVTPEHWDAFSRQLGRLGCDTGEMVKKKQLVVFDAQQTLDRFMVRRQPEWRLFETVVNQAMREVKPGSDAGASLRAYGEMVGILWKAGQFAAAIRLEQLWNKLLEQSSFSLYCAYAIDIFGKEFHPVALDDILNTHSHLVPAQPNGELDNALNQAMDELLGPKADETRTLIRENYRPKWAVMPNAEAIVLWLRKNLPDRADEIVSRARHYYQLILTPAGSAAAAAATPRFEPAP